MALRGIKVLEFAGLAPAPFCGMILSDFGANVLRIDKTGGGTANLDPLGNGKQSISLNLKTPQAVEIIKKLVQSHDVLLEPFRAGVMEKLGLGPDILLMENPKLIYARLTGYGQKGPYSKMAGHDINYLALSGMLSLFGRKHEKPIFPVNYAADFAGGGLICAFGIVMALFERTSSGLGQVIDANMVEGTAYVGSWLYRSQKLPIWGKNRGENFLDSGAHFYEVYETRDNKYVSVGALEPHFYDILVEKLGIGEAPQFDDFEEMKKIFTKKFQEKTQEEWCQIFYGTDACVAPVLSVKEAPKHKHNLERDSFLNSVPKPAPNLSRTPGKTSSTAPPPKQGQHTKKILQSLKYSNEEIDNFIRTGVVDCCENSKL